MVYHPGSENHFSDATSRKPSGESEFFGALLQVCGVLEDDPMEDDDMELAAMDMAGLEEVGTVSWKDIRKASMEDSCIMRLKDMIHEGFPSQKSEMPADLQVYWSQRESLMTVDEVVLNGQRIVIPLLESCSGDRKSVL